VFKEYLEQVIYPMKVFLFARYQFYAILALDIGHSNVKWKGIIKT
jgi:hypothetical protein